MSENPKLYAKDFRRVAAIIGSHRSGMTDDTLYYLIREIEDWLSETNPDFNRARFKAAIACAEDFLPPPDKL